jgi:hypothetical protein
MLKGRCVLELAGDLHHYTRSVPVRAAHTSEHDTHKATPIITRTPIDNPQAEEYAFWHPLRVIAHLFGYSASKWSNPGVYLEDIQCSAESIVIDDPQQMTRSRSDPAINTTKNNQSSSDTTQQQPSMAQSHNASSTMPSKSISSQQQHSPKSVKRRSNTRKINKSLHQIDGQ